MLAFDHATGEWQPRRVEVTHSNRYRGSLVTVETGDASVVATAHHPFWVLDGHRLEERPRCGELSEHEDEGGSLPGRWVNSHDLMAGDMVIGRDGRQLTVRGVRQELVEETRVYNLTVAEDHTFAVGGDMVLVHNTPSCYTRPNLPPETVASGNGVVVKHYTRAAQEHPPAHLHVYGGGTATKIGANGKPMKGFPELSAKQRKVVEANLSDIRKAGNQIRRYWKYILHFGGDR